MKGTCGIEQDAWASTYLALGGGSAVLAVNFYRAAQAEIQLHFDKLGLKDQPATKFYIEAMQFFLDLIDQQRRRLQQESKSTGRRSRRDQKSRRA